MRRRWLWPALAGVAAVAFGLGVAELVASMLAPRASPVLVVGSLMIDLAPPWAKDAAISLFGTADKLALLVGIALVLLVAAAGVGILELRRPWFGAALFAVLGAVVAVLAMTRAGATGLAWLPSLAAGLVAATVVRLL